MSRRGYSEDLKFLRRVSDTKWEIQRGFVPNMLVPGFFYVNSALEPLMFEELQASSEGGGVGGFLPAVSQIANVASLPGIVGASVGLPDTHSGYGFAIGNVAAFDMDNPQAIVSPGGVGFDINCIGEGTLVNLSDGTSLPIESVQAGASVLSLSPAGDGLVPRRVTARLSRGQRDCVELQLLDGRMLTLTSDHLLLSADGQWKAAADLNVGDAVTAGVQYPLIDRQEDGGGWELDLTPSLGLRLNLQQPQRRSQAITFCRVLGHLLTGGSVKRCASGLDGRINLARELDVASMSDDVRLLTGMPTTVGMRRSSKTFTLHLPAALTAAFVAVGVVIGARVEQVLHLPAFICRPGCPLPLVRAFLSGFFAGNGRTVAVSSLDDGRCLLSTVGFSLCRAASVAEEQLDVLQLELGGLLARCSIPAEECEWSVDAAVTGVKGGAEMQMKVQFSRSATLQFADSCGFAHCSEKQLRLSAGAAAFRAQALVASQRQTPIAVVDATTTASLPLKLVKAKRALSHQSRRPQTGSWAPARRARMCRASRGPAGVTINAVLNCMNSLQLFGERCVKPKWWARRNRMKIAASAADEEAAEEDREKENRDDEDGQQEKEKDVVECAGNEDEGRPVSSAVPHRRASLPLFRLPIVAKRAVGVRRVFDLVIDDQTPSFTANGVVVHNCGVRLIRTNLSLADVQPVQEKLTQALFDHIPVGVGSKGVIPTRPSDLLEVLELGIDWSIKEGYAWVEDKEHIEEYGRMLDADVAAVSARARKRGIPQLGTLGAGNHYAEVQVVEEVFDEYAARCMGIDQVGQVCVMIHSGSRGLGHQVATDALVDMEAVMSKQGLRLNDRQLACARINSAEGKKYLAAMAAAANYAFVNRSAMTFLVRQAFASVFQQSADDLEMRLVYDVSHNIAKQETHWVDGREKRLLVHRKGATRAFPAHHPLVPVDYQMCGQPVLIGGSMGTCSYVLTGTELGMKETWGSTCHGAGRAMSRNRSRRQLGWEEVHARLRDSGISLRMASPKLVTEEAPESYKDVTEVVNTCHQAGISKKTVKLRPIAVVKG